MTEHLPECLNDDDTYGWRRWCICEELRACERRVGNLISASLVGGYDWRQGYLAGLDAAREAVAGLDSSGVMYEAEVLAAIDALRAKP